MTKPYEPPRIRKVEGAVGFYLRCPGCDYKSEEIVMPASEAWHGADCPKCGRRLHRDRVRRF